MRRDCDCVVGSQGPSRAQKGAPNLLAGMENAKSWLRALPLIQAMCWDAAGGTSGKLERCMRTLISGIHDDIVAFFLITHHSMFLLPCWHQTKLSQRDPNQK